jgi:hypothetical protein
MEKSKTQLLEAWGVDLYDQVPPVRIPHVGEFSRVAGGETKTFNLRKMPDSDVLERAGYSISLADIEVVGRITIENPIPGTLLCLEMVPPQSSGEAPDLSNCVIVRIKGTGSSAGLVPKS